jgi:hypothetical protein
MSEITFNLWYEEGDIQVLKLQSMNVRKGGEVAQVVGAEFLGREPRPLLLHSYFLDERC